MKCLKIILLAIICTTCFSCNDDDADPAIAQIFGQVTHHNLPIPNATIYIKYNQIEFPGQEPEDYDNQTTASATDASYEFNNMSKGSHYLFAVGYDEACACEVFGGIPITLLTNSEILETDVPVTE